MAISAAAVVRLGGFFAGAASGKCVDLGIISFGCSTASVVERYNRLLDQLTAETVVESMTSVTAEVAFNQKMQINDGAGATVIRPVHSQTITGDPKLVTSTNEEMSSAINAALKTAMVE